TEHADTVVDRHYDEALLRKSFAIVDGHGARTFIESTAIDVEEHGVLLIGVCGGRPNVQRETVFADFVVRHELIGPGFALLYDGLHAACAELIHSLDAGPRDYRLWLAPAQFADGRLGERYALEYQDRGVLARDTGDLAAGDRDGL